MTPSSGPAPEPAPPLSRLDVLRGLRISTWEGIWATAWSILTGGAFQIGFALYLGATPFVLGLLAGLPAIVGLLQLPASLYGDTLPRRRPFVAASSAAGRLLWVPIALLPFALPPYIALWVFLVFLTVSSALITIVVPAWTSWMSDLVPAGSRGQYFARRNTLAGIVSMLLPLPAAAFLDLAVKRGLFAPKIGFAALFLLSAGASAASFILIRRQPEPPHETETDAGTAGLRTLLVPLADRTFRPFLSFAALTVCSQTLAGQFFTAWQVDKAALNLPYLVVQILGAVASGAGLLATPVWGYLNDKYGSRPLLAIASGGVIVAPFIWLFTVPSIHAFWLNVGLIVVINVFSGVAWGGVGLAQFNLLLANSPTNARATYVAMFSAATGVLGGVSPVVGGFLMTALQPLHFAVGPVDFNNYKVLFFMTGLIRIACLFLLARVPSGGEARSTRYVLKQLKQARRPLTSYLTLRRLSRPADEETRREAVHDLADLKTPLAVEELAAALNDVSLEVREGAARALGATGDTRAIPALAQKLADPAAQVGELCAEALGAIGSRDATPYLIAAARGPDASVRVASLRALAHLADPSALPAVIAVLDPIHATTCESACAALSAIAPHLKQADLHDALPRLGYLLSQEVDRGMRLASARTLARLAEVGAPQKDSAFIWNTISTRIAAETDGAVAAQEAVALQKWSRKSGKTVKEAAALLVPLLDRPLSDLAYKQTLGAVADVGLVPGKFYPFLGIAPLDFDETLSRFLTVWAKRTGRNAADAAPVLEAFGRGDFGESLRLIAALAPTTDAAGASPALVVLAALLRRTAATGAAVRPEAVLLAAFLLRDGVRDA